MAHDRFLPLASSVYRAKGWDNVTRAIMLAGKALTRPDAQWLTDNHLVDGCESQVWLVIDNGHIVAWSDAKIVRGVVALVVEKANTLNMADMASFDFATYLAELGLERHLSQSRADGINQVIRQLRHLAARQLA
ncbi:SufE family protein [Salinimonas lutimaris]|uniref:SufE family protein n=1 Tax=Salinimonas lutimaris TaxID=914153 RepID=UPI0010C11134|nr:SufE family protein [Salinimonas lutimaris]